MAKVFALLVDIDTAGGSKLPCELINTTSQTIKLSYQIELFYVYRG
jgi:hypothetical protein